MKPTRRTVLQLLAASMVFVPFDDAFALAPTLSAGGGGTTKRGYITFVINVHEWGHVEGSAEILTNLARLYTKFGVKGEFYVTAPMADRLANKYPDTVAAMKTHGISYHVRPPHPLYTGFDAELKAKTGDDLTNMIKDFETYGQNLTTGALDKSRSGGYTRVKEVFGKAPCAVSAQNENTKILTAAAAVYKSLGAKMLVAFHEGESDPDNPLVNKYNLLARPSHLKLTHSTGDEFWWNTVASGKGGDPTDHLKEQLDAWQHSKLPYAVAIVHENNFYRYGPESWTSVYFKDKEKKTMATSPYNLDAEEWGKSRDEDARKTIWSAYRKLVEYCAENLNVVTSEDIVKLSSG